MIYPAETRSDKSDFRTRKKQKWVDVFCPRCGEPLGFKDMMKVGSVMTKKCYDCGGECVVIHDKQNLWTIIYKREK